jgi:hypothetical protein
MPEEQFASLVAGLQNSPPIITAGKLARRVATATNLEVPIADLLLESFVSLCDLRNDRGVSTVELTEALYTALGNVKDRVLQPNDAERKALADRIEQVLDAESPLGVLTKASSLWTEHEHIFVEAHIATDMRPVFKDDLDAPLTAALIVHTLRLTYLQGSERKDFYVALDIDDIDKFRAILDRAELKAKSLNSLLATADVPVFGGVEE